jgi:hypothetical protein
MTYAKYEETKYSFNSPSVYLYLLPLCYDEVFRKNIFCLANNFFFFFLYIKLFTELEVPILELIKN